MSHRLMVPTLTPHGNFPASASLKTDRSEHASSLPTALTSPSWRRVGWSTSGVDTVLLSGTLGASTTQRRAARASIIQAQRRTGLSRRDCQGAVTGNAFKTRRL